MSKINFKLLLLVFIMVLVLNTKIFAKNTKYVLNNVSYKILINNNEYVDENLPILNYNGFTYAPMRSMLESSGFNIEFKDNTAYVKKSSEVVKANTQNKNKIKNQNEYILYEANYKVLINDKTYKDEKLPILNYNGYTYAPMRSMLESSGLSVVFENNKAIIETKAQDEYMKIKDLGLENSTLIASFNLENNRTIEILDADRNLILVIPKEETVEKDGLMLISKKYYLEVLEPLIKKYKK